MRVKKYGAALIIAAGIVIIALVIIINHKKDTITYNAADVPGNSGGNLLNGGLFCELEDRIYFSNMNDNGSLYSMNLDATRFEKLAKDRVKYINGAGKYIYYTRKNNEKKKSSEKTGALDFHLTGMYRIGRDGSNMKCLSSGLNENMKLYGNDIYYEHSTKDGGLTLHKIKIDGEKDEALSNVPVSPTSIVDGVIYYSGIQDNYNIHTYDLATGEDSVLLQEKTMNTIALEDYIYYMSLSDNYGIKRINKDGTNPVTLVKMRSAAYNLSPDGKYLYYQVDDGESNGIYRLNTGTNEVMPILSGNFNNINIAGNYVFFQEFRTDNMFYAPVGEEGKVSAFNPPVLK